MWVAFRSNRHASDAVNEAKRANNISAETKLIAEREFKRNTEQPVIDWRFGWDFESQCIRAVNVGLDHAHEVTITAHRKGHTNGKGFTEHQKELEVPPGEAIELHIPQITQYPEPDRPLRDFAGLTGTTILDIVREVANDHGFRDRAQLDSLTAGAIGLRFSEVHYVVRWKTPAGTPKTSGTVPMEVTWRDHSTPPPKLRRSGAQ